MMKRKSPDGSSQSISKTTNHGSIDQSVHHHHAPTFYQQASGPTQPMESDSSDDSVATVRYNIPVKNESFVSRTVHFDELCEHFQSQSATHILCGLGGSGKTQLANKFLLDKTSDYQLVAKLRAENESILQEDLIALGKQLNLEILRSKLKKEKALQVVFHLSNNFKGKLLLLYDNTQSHDQINSYIPTYFNQHVLVTSRDRTNWVSCTTQEIGPMTEEEAIVLLCKLINKQLKDNEAEYAKKLIGKERLGYLPLAIAQAGVYIRNCSISIKDYLKLYEGAEKKLLEQELPEGLEHKAVYVTFDININYLREHYPSALTLINICAYCNADQIPEWFLQAVLQIDQMTFNECKRSVNQHSLLDFNPDTKSASIHRVLQTVRQLQNTYASDFEVLKKLITWMNNRDNYFYNYDDKFFERNAKFLIHASSIVDYIVKKHIAVEMPPFVFYTIGLFYLDYEYDPTKAESYLRIAIDRVDKAEGNKLQAKICRQYAKVLSRLNPENIQQIKTYFDKACQYDRTLTPLTIVDKLVQEYDKIAADRHLEMRGKVEKLEALTKQCKTLINDDKYDTLKSYLQYTQLKIIYSLLWLLEELIELKNDDLSKLPLSQTSKKSEFQSELRDFESKYNENEKRMSSLQRQLEEEPMRVISPKTAAMLNYQLAKVAKQGKQYQEALVYIEKTWGLRGQLGNHDQKLRILIFYADILVKNNQRDESKRLLESERCNFSDKNKEKLEKKLKEISTQPTLFESLTCRVSKAAKVVKQQCTQFSSSLFGGNTEIQKKHTANQDAIEDDSVHVSKYSRN